MSTMFAVKTEEGLQDVALRYGGPNGVIIDWKNPIFKLLPSEIEVIATDNTPQGVYTIGDLKKLEDESK